jgi:glycine/D-amino acid oxidase-like deaminating enzyme/nitrite reductase/ring-hydroxylating ferredoxin subunit
MPNYKTALWSDVESGRQFSALPGDISADIAIVGGGITGVTAARLLTEAGLHVVLLESRRLGSGETKRTTAHLTEVLDARFQRLLSNFGEEGARLALRGQRAAIKQIDTFVQKLAIDCQLERLPGYLMAETSDEERELETEAEAARKLGISATLVTEIPLPFQVRRALRFDGQAQLHPTKYLNGLVADLAGPGCDIFETTHVQEIIDGEPCQVITDRGTVSAKDVIVASGVPISNRYLIHPKLAAYRTHAIALALPGASAPGLFWDMKDPYHYVRGQVVDGMFYLIVGGEDHKVGEGPESDGPFRRLDHYLETHFERSSTATDFRWSGQIIESADGLPYVGRNSSAKHVFIASGYSGNGMTNGTLAAMVLSDQVRKVDNDWTSLLEATRIKPVASARAVISENIAFPKHLLKDRLLPLGRKGVEQIRSGEGAVVSVNGRKLAVYRNSEGQLSAVSPVCPHLGCLVQWNTTAKSWDCPCHGSRFDPAGRVLNGPAVSALAPKALPAANAVAETAKDTETHG